MSTPFRLLPSQRALIEVPHQLDTDIACYLGGMGSGKTTAGVWCGYLLSLLYPQSRGLVGARSYALLRDTTRERWRELVAPGLIAKESRTPDNLTLKNGSEIWFRHLSDPGRLASMEFNWIHIDEGAQISEAVFHTLLARLRHTGFACSRPTLKRRFRLFITTTPEERRGWLHETFVAPVTKRENLRLIRAPTAENHFLLARKPDYLDMLRGVMDEEEASRRLLGESTLGVTGRVYRAFLADRNVCKTAAYDPSRVLHLSFDFNVDFMIALFIQERADDTTLVVDECVCRDNAETRRLCEAIRARIETPRAGVVIHGDASGFARSHRGRDHDYAIIKESLADWPSLRLKHKSAHHNPSVRERTNAVNARLLNARGETRLLINPRCRFLIKSLEETRFLPDRFEKEKTRDPKDARFVVDHPGDALDYYVADESPGVRTRITALVYG